jgi:hypothetical protein
MTRAPYVSVPPSVAPWSRIALAFVAAAFGSRRWVDWCLSYWVPE